MIRPQRVRSCWLTDSSLWLVGAVAPSAQPRAVGASAGVGHSTRLPTPSLDEAQGAVHSGKMNLPGERRKHRGWQGALCRESWGPESKRQHALTAGAPGRSQGEHPLPRTGIQGGGCIPRGQGCIPDPKQVPGPWDWCGCHAGPDAPGLQEPQHQVTEDRGLGKLTYWEPGGTRGLGRGSKDTQWAVGAKQNNLLFQSSTLSSQALLSRCRVTQG